MWPAHVRRDNALAEGAIGVDPGGDGSKAATLSRIRRYISGVIHWTEPRLLPCRRPQMLKVGGWARQVSYNASWALICRVLESLFGTREPVLRARKGSA